MQNHAENHTLRDWRTYDMAGPELLAAIKVLPLTYLLARCTYDDMVAFIRHDDGCLAICHDQLNNGQPVELNPLAAGWREKSKDLIDMVDAIDWGRDDCITSTSQAMRKLHHVMVEFAQEHGIPVGLAG